MKPFFPLLHKSVFFTVLEKSVLSPFKKVFLIFETAVIIT